jgi:hypothetical protein
MPSFTADLTPSWTMNRHPWCVFQHTAQGTEFPILYLNSPEAAIKIAMILNDDQS